jgi:hypothetical protein
VSSDYVFADSRLTAVYVQLERLARTDTLEAAFWQSVLEDMELEHQSCYSKWFGFNGSECPHYAPWLTSDERHLSLASRLVLKFIGLSTTLAIKFKFLDLNINVTNTTTEFMSIIPTVVDQMEAIASAGILVFMHDVTSVALSHITLEVYKVSPCHDCRRTYG